MRLALFWDMTQRWMVVLYRRFGTTWNKNHVYIVLQLFCSYNLWYIYYYWVAYILQRSFMNIFRDWKLYKLRVKLSLYLTENTEVPVTKAKRLMLFRVVIVLRAVQNTQVRCVYQLQNTLLLFYVNTSNHIKHYFLLAVQNRKSHFLCRPSNIGT
jgi:hypothetical protein